MRIGQAWGWLALILLALPAAVHAETFFITTNADDTITITGYAGLGDTVIIPSNINGRAVTHIGKDAFRAKTNMLNLSIPASVINIGTGAFTGCTGLLGVEIPDSVIQIGRGAFYDCTSLNNIIIGSSVTNIEGTVFGGCSGLTNVSLPNSIVFIGFWAFGECAGLTNMTIPASVIMIEEEAFALSTNIVEFAVDESNPAYCSPEGVLLNRDQTVLVQYPLGKGGDYVIPGGVTDIYSLAFSYCSGLTNIVIPGGVQHIGLLAFGSCDNLTRAYFAGNAPSLGDDVFYLDGDTIFRLPRAEGWPAVPGLWADRPTAYWLPEVAAEAMCVQEGRFGFNMDWAAGKTVVVEACTSLIEQDWIPVGTNILIGGSSNFGDSEWSNHVGRFYRIREP